MNWFVLCSLLGLALSQGINDVAPSQGINDVTLIVGGVNNYNTVSSSNILSSVEIFGCPSGESVVVDDFPFKAYLTAGTYLPEEGAVLLCGGFACNKEGNKQDCNVEDKCFKWNPENGWQPATSLSSPVWAHILASGPNLNKPGDNTWIPMTFSLGRDVNIFDNDEQAWLPYRDIPVTISGRCLVQEGSKVYFSDTDDQLNSLDLFTWEVTTLANLPTLYGSSNSGKCTIAYVKGNLGKQY